MVYMKKIFTRLFDYKTLKRKYNTLENKYETLQRTKSETEEELVKVQKKYIALLEKVTDIDKLQKSMKTKLNELEMKGKK